MATTAAISLETYLKTSYRPDCDYVDGELEERNLGEREHARLQAAIVAWFFAKQKEWNIDVLPEQRTRVSASRVRIPDVSLVSLDLPYEKIITHPPLAVIEILSPEDRVRRYNERLEDYRRMGVRNIWVVDPESRMGYDWTLGWQEAARFEIAETPIYLDIPEIFAALPPQ